MSKTIENKDEVLDNTSVQDSTTVEEVEVNIDEIFGQPGAENVLIPEEGEEIKEKNTVFSQEKELDTTFIDKPVETSKTEEVDAQKDEAKVEETIAELDEMITAEEEVGSKTGRPKVDKNGLIDLANKMIEEGSLLPFDDDKPIEDYTTKDFRELFESNFQQ